MNDLKECSFQPSVNINEETPSKKRALNEFLADQQKHVECF
jgi:uncharacterized protein (UPF0216 family)